MTLMWFDSLDSVKAFMGEDYEVAHVPVEAQAVLADFDKRSVHYHRCSTAATSPGDDSCRAGCPGPADPLPGHRRAGVPRAGHRGRSNRLPVKRRR